MSDDTDALFAIRDAIFDLRNELSQKFGHPELRDQLAMSALTGLLAYPNGDFKTHEHWAEDAYAFADAMIEARKVKP